MSINYNWNKQDKNTKTCVTTTGLLGCVGQQVVAQQYMVAWHGGEQHGLAAAAGQAQVGVQGRCACGWGVGAGTWGAHVSKCCMDFSLYSSRCRRAALMYCRSSVLKAFRSSSSCEVGSGRLLRPHILSAWCYGCCCLSEI